MKRTSSPSTRTSCNLRPIGDERTRSTAVTSVTSSPKTTGYNSRSDQDYLLSTSLSPSSRRGENEGSLPSTMRVVDSLIPSSQVTDCPSTTLAPTGCSVCKIRKILCRPSNPCHRTCLKHPSTRIGNQASSTPSSNRILSSRKILTSAHNPASCQPIGDGPPPYSPRPLTSISSSPMERGPCSTETSPSSLTLMSRSTCRIPDVG